MNGLLPLSVLVFLGHALVHYRGFQSRGFKIVCLFDNSSTKIGETVGELVIQPDSELEATIEQKQIEVAIIVVPINVAQSITDRLVKAGVKALLSYVPINLDVPDDVHVSYSDPVCPVTTHDLLPQPKVVQARGK